MPRGRTVGRRPGHAGRGGRGKGSANDEEGRFEPKAPKQERDHDDLNETKFGRRQEKIKELGLGGFGKEIRFLEDDPLDGLLTGMSGIWSDDDDDTKAGPVGKGEKAGGWLGLGAASKVDMVADFRSIPRAEGDGSGAGPSSSRFPMPEGAALRGGRRFRCDQRQVTPASGVSRCGAARRRGGARGAGGRLAGALLTLSLGAVLSIWLATLLLLCRRCSCRRAPSSSCSCRRRAPPDAPGSAALRRGATSLCRE